MTTQVGTQELERLQREVETGELRLRAGAECSLTNPPQMGPSQMGPSEMGPSQMGPSQMGPNQINPPQLGPSQIGPGLPQCGPD